MVGCSAAAFLAEAGRSVTLLESTAVAAGASGRNSGSIQHPFDPVLLPLYLESLATYQALAEADPGFALPTEPVGILLLTHDPDAARARAADLATSFPELGAEALDTEALADLEPALSSGLSAVRVSTGYPATPDGATHALAARAVRAGVTVRIGRTARPWVEDGRVRGASLDDGELLSAEQVLVAGGPFTPEILGADPEWPPITRTWGVTVQIALAKAPRHILEEGVVHTVNVPTGRTGSVFSLMSVGGVSTVGSTFLTDAPDPETMAPQLVARGSAFVPALAEAPIRGIRLCARPQSVDGRPFIGPVPGVEGLFVCAGHGPWGISTGPGSAALVADLMLGRADRVPPDLRADRPTGLG